MGWLMYSRKVGIYDSLRSARMYLSKEDRLKVRIFSIAQAGLNILDFGGVALSGVVAALAVNGLEGRKPGGRVSEVLSLLHLIDKSLQYQVSLLSFFVACMLLTRTLGSIYFMRKSLNFLSTRGALLSSKLVESLLAKSILEANSKTPQETLFAVTQGVFAITLGIIAPGITLLSDIALLIILTFGLFLLSPILALSTTLCFGILSIATYKLSHVKSTDLGSKYSYLSIQSNQKIIEMLDTLKEIKVRSREIYYETEVKKSRYKLAKVLSQLSYLPYTSKYVIEIGVVVGTIIIAGIQFITQDAHHAIAGLAIFSVAGMRIAPAVLRIQQGTLLIRRSAGEASTAFIMLEESSLRREEEFKTSAPDYVQKDFHGAVSLKNVSFRYPGTIANALTEVSLEIERGDVIALVGPSGSGKTTLAEVILGLLSPSQGLVLISGLPPGLAIKNWPGEVAYVPQDVRIVNGTIRENISIGYPSELATDDALKEILEIAQLSKLISELPNGLDQDAGDRGAKLSGGQRQRLGIARSLFSHPKILVLDEATSALDAALEVDLTSAIESLRGNTTIIVIAHRISTIRNADKIVFLNEGRVLGVGKYDELKRQIPEFDNQIKLSL